MRRTLLILGGVLAVAVAGFVVFRPGEGTPDESLIAERTAWIEWGDMDVWVTGTGNVQPKALAALAFKAQGNVGRIHVQVGDEVLAGQVLMELDQDSLDASLIGAEADLIAAQEQLETLLESPTAQQLASAQLLVAQARDALEDAQFDWRVQQQGFRANDDTIDAAEARLVLAERGVDQAKAAYDRLSDHSSDDPARALALTNLVAARQERDAALRSLNWYTGHPTDIQQAILDAEVAMAEADLKEAEEVLQELRAGPDQDDVIAAQARVDAAQAIVDQAKLIAPFDGTVMSIDYRLGDSVVPGQTGIVIADLTALHINTLVDELDLATIETGQEVEITLDALPEVILSGRVMEIALAPASESSTIEYPVKIQLDSVDGDVRIGMTAALSILVAHKDDILLVPNWALRLDPESGEIYVTVLRTGEEGERVPLVLGLRNEAYSEVVSGLSGGEQVGIILTPEPNEFRGPFGGG